MPDDIAMSDLPTTAPSTATLVSRALSFVYDTAIVVLLSGSVLGWIFFLGWLAMGLP